ncbi:hypothetical protein KJ780_03720 [Candidatus Micrarchaeota archaeon]|nr:hypothetical protein [Candidatus Micrarchaeota archaeon]
MSKTIFLLFGIFLLSSIAFAESCSSFTYSKACQYCEFDDNGKMDASCYNGYKTSGIMCTSTDYPIASAAYAAGKCPEIDECASKLESCKAMVASGNDKKDCQDGYVADCFAESDNCMMQAAIKCGDSPKACPFATSAILGIILLAGYFKFKGQ